MNFISNYHTHSSYCDGQNTLEEMVEAAIDKGYKYLGFSSHAPLPYANSWTIKNDAFDKYIENVKVLQTRNNIKIFLGLEIDYLYDVGLNPLCKDRISELDYYIGSVHELGRFEDGTYWSVDYTREMLERGIDYSYEGNIQRAVSVYYNSIGDMVERNNPDIIGHIDLIKKNNKNNHFFNENDLWYQKEILNCLNRIEKTNCIIEINTGGVARYGTDCLYPSDWILKEIYKRNIPITVNADAHSAEAIDCYFEEVYRLIKEIGFTKTKILTEKGWGDYFL